MSADRHLTWENFERDILEVNVPATHPIQGSPEVSIFHLIGPKRIGLYIALTAPLLLPPSEYQEIQVSIQTGCRGPMLAVWTSNQHLFRPFFSLMLEIADSVQLERVAPKDAVQFAVDQFSSVIQKDSSLSIERIVGFWAEFEVLARLLSCHGSPFFANWNGWRSDRHDFRISTLELEVKATLAAESIHVINGLNQLSPSDGHSLYLLSFQLIRSESGMTLSDQVKRVTDLVIADSSALTMLETAKKELGLSNSNLAMSKERLLLRGEPRLIPIDNAVPRLTSDTLNQVIAPQALARLTELHYRVNFTGLGYDSETHSFRKLLPWMFSDDN